jgi:hypothetical protein
VPETALFWRWQPERRTSATQTDTRKIFEKENQTRVANKERIDRSKVARHYGPEKLGKEMAGYSGTPLAQKLGIKAQQKVITIGAPAQFARGSRGPS